MRNKNTQLPPNQVLASPNKWPVVGESAPQSTDHPWTLTISGLVAEPRSWPLAELKAMDQHTLTTDIHCVTRWSKPAMTFTGLPLASLLAQIRPLDEARFISFAARSSRNHTTSLPLVEATELGTFIAFTQDGHDLSVEHGGPMRTITPARYFYKSLKWLEHIELLAQDRLGWWEDQAGYHNNADPLREQRYISRRHDRRAVMAMIKDRDLAHQDLLGLEAPGINLAGLNATGALLRNADFRRANLTDADFTQANLSNAHFQGADLRGTCFKDADLEGCSFFGADLRQVDFSGASLFGTTFCPEPGDIGNQPATRDGTTKVQSDQLEVLTQRQRDFLTGAV